MVRGKKSAEIGLDDVERAIKKMSVLGNGFRLVQVRSRVLRLYSVCCQGCGAWQLGSRKLIVSVPYELNTDHTQVLAAAEVRGNCEKTLQLHTVRRCSVLRLHGQATGYVTASQLKSSFRWDDERVMRTVNNLLREGMAWLDAPPSSPEPLYWFPSITLGASAA